MLGLMVIHVGNKDHRCYFMDNENDNNSEINKLVCLPIHLFVLQRIIRVALWSLIHCRYIWFSTIELWSEGFDVRDL